jgi:hypothetical protein
MHWICGELTWQRSFRFEQAAWSKMQVDDWLEREIQKVISDEEVDAFFSLRRVAEFIIDHPGERLPDALLSLLINFLQTKHELKVRRAGGGRPENPWYALADGLVANGLTLEAAVKLVKARLGIEAEESAMLTSFKRYRQRTQTWKAREAERFARDVARSIKPRRERKKKS